MTLDPTIREQVYRYFLQEAPDLLQALEQNLTNLQQDSSLNTINDLMRVTHTLKGAAASVGLETIASVAHLLEDIFRALCRPGVTLDPEIEALLFEGFECLRLPLRAELTGGSVNHAEVLDHMATVFGQLQEKLGDGFDQNVPLPSSAELGFDLAQSLFEVGVAKRLDQLATAVAAGQPEVIAPLLRTQAEVFLGLAESLNLEGFEAIAQTTLTALDRHPDQGVAIARQALADFQAGQEAVLAGDRQRGGEPSQALLSLAGEAEGLTRAMALPASPSGSGPSAVAGAWPALRGCGSLLQWLGSLIRRPVHPSVSGPSQSRSSTQERGFALPPYSSQPAEQTAEPPPPIDGSSIDAAADRLMEIVWGNDDVDLAATTTLTPSIPMASDELAPPERDGLSPVAPSFDPPSNHSRGAPTPLSKTGGTTASPTVRVNIEQLEQLNYSVGELLTNQNRQSLDIEQMQGAVKVLYGRLQHHRQWLDQLQDWSADQAWTGGKGYGGNGAVRQRENSTQQILFSGALSPNPSAQGAVQTEFDVLELERYTEPQLLIQSLMDETVQLTEAADAIALFTQQCSQTLEKQQRLLTHTRDALIEARMMPLGTIIDRLPPLLKQLETRYNKPVVLELRGTEVLVDKLIAEKLYDPLLHLVRNAFDHGIEPVTVRRQRGKPEQGVLQISAHHQGKHLVIDVVDDGNGLDFERIRERALERQLVSPQQAHDLNQAQLAELLFEPGFSTVSQVSDLSGRGIGLDVVRNQLRALQGEVRVFSKPYQGSTFTLKIPLSLNVARLLLCQAGAKVYALLPDAIEHILIPQPGQLQNHEDGKVLRWGAGEDERLVPIYALDQNLNYHSPVVRYERFKPLPATSQGDRHILVFRHQDTLRGLEVEHMLGEQELIIRPLGRLIDIPAYIYGASILADGQLTLVIDGIALMQQIVDQQTAQPTDGSWSTARRPLEPSAVEREQLPGAPATGLSERSGVRILIVDDSITTRQSLTLTLQKAGYQVIQAKNGQEAIAQLKNQLQVQLVICDIEMPGMNGFEFLSHCQQDPELADISVAMLTSRSSQKHRQLAEQLGAMAYLSKPYLEHKLLAMVAELTEADSQKTDGRSGHG